MVPKGAMYEKIPPKEPAFFNPRAKRNRDFSLIAYAAFMRNFDGPRVFLEGLSGLGARGLRVANEIGGFEKIILNDLNPSALELARRSAKKNNLDNIETSEKETCVFLSEHSRKGLRGTIVDIDPFGSPAKFLDCGIRATIHGGMLSFTATDLQVLNGLFDSACKRRYGGVPMRVKFGDEIALRLILGCLCQIAGRLDTHFEPLFVQSDQHYYRVFVRILNRPEQTENLGYLFYCKQCGERGVENTTCPICGEKTKLAGPLWVGSLFEKEFVCMMQQESAQLCVDKTCERDIQKTVLEAEMPPTYYTLDEVASRQNTSPASLKKTLELLQKNGYKASPTSFEPTGFRTDAGIDKIAEIL